MAYALPYPDHSFDRVLSSLVIHHLTSADKHRAFQEVLRVLRPNGEFHIVDFGLPKDPGAWLISLLMRNLEQARDNIEGKLPGMLSAAGFAAVLQTTSMNTIFGSITLLRALKSIIQGNEKEI